MAGGALLGVVGILVMLLHRTHSGKVTLIFINVLFISSFSSLILLSTSLISLSIIIIIIKIYHNYHQHIIIIIII
jgi:hypothetical protein